MCCGMAAIVQRRAAARGQNTENTRSLEIGRNRHNASRRACNTLSRERPMHGTIFSELQQFVVARLGEGAWEQLKRSAGIDPAKQYEIFRSYPDEEVGALVGAASAATGIPVPALLE